MYSDYLPTKLGHLLGLTVGKYSSTMVRIWVSTIWSGQSRGFTEVFSPDNIKKSLRQHGPTWTDNDLGFLRKIVDLPIKNGDFP
jgi:hypothetical protein